MICQLLSAGVSIEQRPAIAKIRSDNHSVEVSPDHVARLQRFADGSGEHQVVILIVAT